MSIIIVKAFIELLAVKLLLFKNSYDFDSLKGSLEMRWQEYSGSAKWLICLKISQTFPF